MAVIQIEHLSKHFRVLNRHPGLGGAVRDLFSNDYRIVRAVDDISLVIEPGEIVGYIGPNGAGKSTTIKMMTGVLKPTEGTLLVNGKAPFKHRQENAQHIGVIFGQRTQLWWDLPVIESFRILKQIYQVDDQAYERNLGMFNDLVDLEALYAKSVRTLSLGQRTLCDIAAAFLHSPKIVFLDEPTIGLDISIKSKIRALIRELNQAYNTTIVLTTHDISDIEALCRRVVIIDKGKIIFDDAIEKVNDLFGAYRTLKVQVSPSAAEMKQTIEGCIQARFNSGFTVSQDDEDWIDITIDQQRLLLRDVLSLMMEQFQVNDVKITEIAMASVIKRIYDGVAP